MDAGGFCGETGVGNGVSAGRRRKCLVTIIDIADVATVWSNAPKGKALTRSVYAVVSEAVVIFIDPVGDAKLSVCVIEKYMYHSFTCIDGLNERRIIHANLFLLLQ